MQLDARTAARALEAALHAYKHGLLDEAAVRHLATALRAELGSDDLGGALTALEDQGPRVCLRLPHDEFPFGRGLDERAELCLHASLVESGADDGLLHLAEWLADSRFGDLELAGIGERCRTLLAAGLRTTAEGLASGLLATIRPTTRAASHWLAPRVAPHAA